MDSGNQAPAAENSLNPILRDTPTSVDQSPPSYFLETPIHNDHEAALIGGPGEENSHILQAPSPPSRVLLS